MNTTLLLSMIISICSCYEANVDPFIELVDTKIYYFPFKLYFHLPNVMTFKSECSYGCVSPLHMLFSVFQGKLVRPIHFNVFVIFVDVTVIIFVCM